MKKSEFQERFEGRNSFMNKEGFLGIVQNTHTPINKILKPNVGVNPLEI